MTEPINCIYVTPCGWCSKWDKKCDRKISESDQKTKDEPRYYYESDPSNIYETVCVCSSEKDHIWECIRSSTAGNTCKCLKCGIVRLIPPKF